MKTEWKKCKLGDICLINTALYSTSDNYSFINYLDTGSITQNKIEKIQKINLSIEKLPSRAKRRVKYNSIIYSTVRPNQRHYGIIKNHPENFIVSTGFAVIDVDTEKANPDFIYYILIQDEIINSLQAVAEQSVSTYPSIKPSDIEKLDIFLPPLPVQKKIAGILKSLDDKIELNRQISKNLEEQAQAIYKNTFITNTQSSWKRGYLSDLIDVKYGKDHKKFSDGIYPVYGSGGIMRYIEKPLYSKESVLIPRKGTLNNVIYVNEPFWSVDTMFYTEMKRTHIAKFIFHFLKNKDLASLNAGSAVPSMTTNILNAMELPIPDDSTFLIFDNLVTPLYTKIQANEKQSLHLAQIRDTILPKLMCGEIEV